ncbi:Transposase, Mutator family [Leptolyngbya sp. O-77]|nr:Transposase, Mutator family [Leptolyngbya sp. O-77]
MPRRRRPQDKVDHLLDELLADYSTPEQILGEQGLLKQLTKRLVERALQAELSHHLETEVQAPPPEETSSSKRRNSRNGYSSKTVKADCGELALSIPRDRNSTFEPILVPKGERRLSGLDDKIMAMYARGLSTRDIQAQLEELYGVEVSPTLISQVTDAVSDEVRQWQNRPLAKLYPIVYLDAIHVHVREDGRVSNHAVYVVLGVTLDGIKEVLGLWMSANEGAKFWLKVLTDLKNRGVEDIFIACVDGLKGFPDAIAAVFPKTRVQLCIVHLIRNSLRYVPWGSQAEVIADLKPIYQAATVEEAETALENFADKWDRLYPTISQIWLRHWNNIIPSLTIHQTFAK